ncbi:MAG: hypothetical protein U5K74_10700 [Gemmatimonadaceae bacterium]|nr:hypothetical protein [Gemmatimonadaceae bacterium]
MTRSRLEEVARLLAEVLRGPAFPAADVERRREERLAELMQQLAEPRGLADERFSGLPVCSEAAYARAMAARRSVAR